MSRYLLKSLKEEGIEKRFTNLLAARAECSSLNRLLLLVDTETNIVEVWAAKNRLKQWEYGGDLPSAALDDILRTFTQGSIYETEDGWIKYLNRKYPAVVPPASEIYAANPDKSKEEILKLLGEDLHVFIDDYNEVSEKAFYSFNEHPTKEERTQELLDAFEQEIDSEKANPDPNRKWSLVELIKIGEDQNLNELSQGAAIDVIREISEDHRLLLKLPVSHFELAAEIDSLRMDVIYRTYVKPDIMKVAFERTSRYQSIQQRKPTRATGISR